MERACVPDVNCTPGCCAFASGLTLRATAAPIKAAVMCLVIAPPLWLLSKRPQPLCLVPVVFKYPPSLHNKHHATKSGDVFRRIALHGDEIGLKPGRDRADLFVHAQRFRAE